MDGSAFSEAPTFDYSIAFEETTISATGKSMTATGLGTFLFEIPEDTQLEVATIAFVVDADGVTQNYGKPVVIAVPEKLTIDFFPETGYYVADIVNKVYFAAYVNQERYDFVDFSDAKLISYDSDEKKSTEENRISTDHRGKGVFEFTPVTDKQYMLEVEIEGTVLERELFVYGLEYNEVNFRLKNKDKVLENNEDLKLEMEFNDNFLDDSLYILQVNIKERTIYSEQFELSNDKKLSKTIDSSLFDAPNGGTFQVNLYRLTEDFIAYAEYMRENGYESDDSSRGGEIDGIDWIEVEEPVEIIAQTEPSSTSPPIEPSSKRPDIINWNEPKGEILFFKKPADFLRMDVEIVGNKDTYAPGDLVEFEVTISDNTLFDSKQDTFLSVTVTDDSVFSRIEDKLQPPTFGSAIYLAYDVLNHNYQFQYPNEYVEHIFLEKDVDYSSDENLDLLLSIQQWRYGIFELPYIQQLRDDFYEMTDEEKA